MKQHCYVQLGRNGDVLNILPLLHQDAKYNSSPTNLLVSREYSQLLDGCSYVNPIPFQGDFADLNGALRANRSRFKDFRVTQVYAHGLHLMHHTESFLIESWHRVGRAQDWGQLPLIFDRRNFQREKALLNKHLLGAKPVILVAPRGISSPFHHWKQLFDLLHSELSDQFQILDLAQVRADRFYDLLGLFDHAKALITIDTGHMHLARASKVPTIALVTDGPTPWHTSAPITGQVLRMKYSEFPHRSMEIVQTIRNLPGIQPTRRPTTKETQVISSVETTPHQPTLIHVYSDYQRQGDSLRRHQFAASTWLPEYKRANWIACPILNYELTRTSASVFSDNRQMPFIKDLINTAILKKHPKPMDLLVLTNDDICLVSGISKFLLQTTHHRASWANRWDFRSLTHHLTPEQCRTGSWCCGTDLFCFTRSWWEAHIDQFPDMVLGCEAWDWLMRELIRDTGGFEIHCAIYHAIHPSYWQSGSNRFKNAGNVWNQRLAKSWLSSRGKPLRELEPLKV